MLALHVLDGHVHIKWSSDASESSCRSYCKGWFCITHGRGCPMSSWSRYVFQKDPAHSCSPSWLGPVMSCHCRLSCTQWITIVQEYPNLRILSESGAEFSLCNEECASLSQLLVQPIRSTERPTDSSLQRRWLCGLFVLFWFFLQVNLLCVCHMVPHSAYSADAQEKLWGSDIIFRLKEAVFGLRPGHLLRPELGANEVEMFPGSETDQCIAPTSHGPSLEWSAVLN